MGAFWGAGGRKIFGAETNRMHLKHTKISFSKTLCFRSYPNAEQLVQKKSPSFLKSSLPEVVRPYPMTWPSTDHGKLTAFLPRLSWCCLHCISEGRYTTNLFVRMDSYEECGLADRSSATALSPNYPEDAWGMLMRYTHLRAEDLVERLG